MGAVWFNLFLVKAGIGVITNADITDGESQSPSFASFHFSVGWESSRAPGGGVEKLQEEFKGEMAGLYLADIVKLKSVKSLTSVMEAQLLNYLRLSGNSVGYLLNFRNSRLEFRRRVLT